MIKNFSLDVACQKDRSRQQKHDWNEREISEAYQDAKDWKEFTKTITEWQRHVRSLKTKLKEFIGSRVAASYREVARNLDTCISKLLKTYKNDSDWMIHWALEHESKNQINI